MQRWIDALRLFGHAVVVLMVLAIGYAAFIAAWHWSGISV